MSAIRTPILGYCNKCDQPADDVACYYSDFNDEWVVTIRHHGESATIRVPTAQVQTERHLTVSAFEKAAA